MSKELIDIKDDSWFDMKDKWLDVVKNLTEKVKEHEIRIADLERLAVLKAKE